MALAKNQMPHDSCIGMVQVPAGLSSPGPYTADGYNKTVLEEEACSESGLVKNIAMSHSSPLFGPSSMNSNAFVFTPTSYQSGEAPSLIDFKSGYGNFMHACDSLLSFEQSERASLNSSLKANNHKDEYSRWAGNCSHNYRRNQIGPKCSSDQRLLEEFNSLQTASNYSSITNTSTKDDDHGDGAYGWLYSEATVVADSIQECGTHETSVHKRAHMNRRERISERLKILQELVPNGSKVDLVTMLEKAISYVKFLQLQVKVLATDEFWPVQGGKAPDISQVKEAIDAILSSQRDRNSRSK